MFPPIEQHVLEKNPKFTKLHKQITSAILKADGTTPEQSKAAERTLLKELEDAQVLRAKWLILRDAVQEVATAGMDLPDGLRGVIDIVSQLLKSEHDTASREHLNEDVESFLDHLGVVGSALSDSLRQTMLDISAIAKPLFSNTPSQPGRSLPGSIEAQRQLVSESYEHLATQRFELTNTACMVLDAHARLLETIIHILEQTKHGSVARTVKAQAEHLAVVAESMEAKLRLMRHDAMSSIYTEDVRAALCQYEEHLRDTDGRVQQREKGLEEELARYADMGGDEVRTIVARYGQISKEIETTRADIKKLGAELD